MSQVFRADEALAAGFVRSALRSSKRGGDPRWDDLPNRFACRSEVALADGRVDLEFREPSSSWRVLVELKIGAGYGFEQIKRYLQALDPRDARQVLVSITRDPPKYGDPPIDETNAHWAGSVVGVVDRTVAKPCACQS